MKFILKVIIPSCALLLSTAVAQTTFEEQTGWIDYKFTGTNIVAEFIKKQISTANQNEALSDTQRSLRIETYNRLLDTVQEEWNAIVEEQNRVRLHYYNMHQGGLGLGIQSSEVRGLLQDKEALLPSPKDDSRTNEELFSQLHDINTKILHAERSIKAELLNSEVAPEEVTATIRKLKSELEAGWQELRSSDPYMQRRIENIGSDKPVDELFIRMDEIDLESRHSQNMKNPNPNFELHYKIRELDLELKRAYAELILPQLPHYQERLELLQGWHKAKAEIDAVVWWRFLEKLMSNKKQKQNQSTHPITASGGSE